MDMGPADAQPLEIPMTFRSLALLLLALLALASCHGRSSASFGEGSSFRLLEVQPALDAMIHLNQRLRLRFNAP